MYIKKPNTLNAEADKNACPNSKFVFCVECAGSAGLCGVLVRNFTVNKDLVMSVEISLSENSRSKLQFFTFEVIVLSKI